MSGALNVYLAGRYSRREELCGYRADLRDRGHDAPTRWLQGEHQVHGVEAAQAVEAGGPVPSKEARLFAEDDVADILGADVLVAFTETPRSSSPSRGGRHVELGIAIGLRRAGSLNPAPRIFIVGRAGSLNPAPRIFIVGPLENVFCALPEIDGAFRSWPQFLVRLDSLPSVHGWSVTGEERCDHHPWHKSNAWHARVFPDTLVAE